MIAVSCTKASSAFQVWALGVMTVTAGQMFAWNVGLFAGTVSFGIGVFVMGIAYLCMVFSIAEVSGVVAFRGGAYGLARCTLGFYSGFIVGCCELLEYSLFATVNCMMVAQTLAAQWPDLAPYTALLCLLTQAFSYGFVMFGGRIFWRTVVLLAVVVLAILLLYYISAMTVANPAVYSGGMDFAIFDGFPLFVTALPQSTWIFSGIEGLSTLGNDLTDPKRVIPKGQVASMVTILVTSYCTYVTAISSPPGIENLPFATGVMNGVFTAALGITDASATMLTLPTLVASTIGLVLAAGNIMVAMAQSKLLPLKLGERHPRLETNVNALAALLAVTSAMSLLLLYANSGNLMFFNVCMVFGLLAYIAQCAGFLYLRRRHKHMERSFVSPVGGPGAVFAMAVFTLTIISLFFCQGDDYIVLVATIAALAALSAFYYLYAKKNQTLSDEEHALFFAHVGTFATLRRVSSICSEIQRESQEEAVEDAAVVVRTDHRKNPSEISIQSLDSQAVNRETFKHHREAYQRVAIHDHVDDDKNNGKYTTERIV
ncbi:hypothetical protein AC1031_003177 [Aphanomyces cochlioides]|nr:hypothetical protein AC1031_003177 [Aphanomyces cochlioides]